MDSERYKSLMDRSLQCIHRAGEINARYTDNPSGITAEEHQQRKSLLQEATRLRDLAETEKQQGELETWAQSPDPAQTHPVLTTAAVQASNTAMRSDGAEFSEASKRLHAQQFAKALLLGSSALNMDETPALIHTPPPPPISPPHPPGPTLPHLPP